MQILFKQCSDCISTFLIWCCLQTFAFFSFIICRPTLSKNQVIREIKQKILQMQQKYKEKQRGVRVDKGGQHWWGHIRPHGRGGFVLSVQFSSVAQPCLTLCDPMNHSTPRLPVHHQLPEFTQTNAHRVGDAIQPSRPLLSPSPPAPNPSQHQGLFQ